MTSNNSALGETQQVDLFCILKNLVFEEVVACFVALSGNVCPQGGSSTVANLNAGCVRSILGLTHVPDQVCIRCTIIVHAMEDRRWSANVWVSILNGKVFIVKHVVLKHIGKISKTGWRGAKWFFLESCTH